MQQKKLLLIAYHFPPIQGSTGTNRTLASCKYLSRLGWDITVLTIDPRAYENTAEQNSRLIPKTVTVCRAWGIDTRKRLSLWGRYPLSLAIPDRWQSWILGGYVAGSSVIKRWRPDLLMSTYPIASAHVIGYLLKRRFRIPWVVELRDPMLQANYPKTRIERWAFRKVEEFVFSHADRIIVTTPGCRRMYQERFPDPSFPSISVISNGFDHELFPNSIEAVELSDERPLVFLHSGLLYPHERNPTAFFEAIRRLLADGMFDRIKAEFHFRAPGHEEAYRQKVSELGIGSVIRILPSVPYVEALAEIQRADALMLFQAENCNDQIPAKAYEYLRAGRPILALTDPIGDTANLLRSVGLDAIAKLEDADAIEQLLSTFLPRLRSGLAYVAPDTEIARFSRQNLTAELADLLDDVLIGEKRK